VSLVNHDPSDDEAARKLMDRLMRLPDKKVWQELESPKYVEQTFRILQGMEYSVVTSGAHANKERTQKQEALRAGLITEGVYGQWLIEHEEWKARASHFRGLVQERRREIEPKIKAARQQRNDDMHRKTLLALVKAVGEHRRAVNEEYEPTELDKQLWLRLDVLRVPHTNSTSITLSELLENLRVGLEKE
jgi:hypothetical protein